MENHAKGELGSEEGEEPLGGIHVCLQVQFLEMGPEFGLLFLEKKKESERDKTSDLINRKTKSSANDQCKRDYAIRWTPAIGGG